jgi:hypothetical protein
MSVKVKLLKGGMFTEPGQVLDLDPGAAARLIAQKRAELVPEHGRTQKMVPQRTAERMNRR